MIEFKPLHRFRVTAPFPSRYSDSYGSIIAIWKCSNLQKLKQAQDIWDRNIHSNTYRPKHPTRPTALDSRLVFNASRLLRVCANIPYLTIVSSTVSRRDKRAQRDSATNNATSGCNNTMMIKWDSFSSVRNRFFEVERRESCKKHIEFLITRLTMPVRFFLLISNQKNAY